MKPPEDGEITRLEAELVVLRKRAKQKHRRANWTFLLAGLGLGTAVYLARTRFSQLVESGRFTEWAIIVGVAVVVFALAARVHGGALRIEEEMRRIEERIVELRR